MVLTVSSFKDLSNIYSESLVPCSNQSILLSMEASQDEPSPTVRKREPSCDTGRSTSAFLLTVVKKLSFVGFIYWTGYMNWSIAWIVTPILLSETREYLTESNNVRRKIAKESAKGNERGAILARIRDLPSWVNDFFILSSCIFVCDASIQRGKNCLTRTAMHDFFYQLVGLFSRL